MKENSARISHAGRESRVRNTHRFISDPDGEAGNKPPQRLDRLSEGESMKVKEISVLIDITGRSHFRDRPPANRESTRCIRDRRLRPE